MNSSDPRLILICCEGQTEENYFTIVKTIRRITSVQITVESFDGKSNTSLIDICVQKRQEMSQLYDMAEDEVEVWAVFDKDGYSGTFTQLEQYADTKAVKLAYSDPQFETYLLQHLSQDASSLSGRQLEDRLTTQINQFINTPLGSSYGAYSKPNLDWLEYLLDQRPSTTLEMAITNSRIRDNRTRTPFLTVHNLTVRLLQFEPK